MRLISNSTHTRIARRGCLFILALSSSLLLSQCGSTGDGSDTSASGTPTRPDTVKKTPGPVRVRLTQAQYQVAAIDTGQPQRRSLSTTLTVNGTIDVPAQNLVSVTVPFGGYIRRINLEPGMRIRKGQPLVVLENPDYIQLQQDYLDTKARLQYADLDFTRQQELSRDNVNALKVFQKVRADRQSLQAQLAGQAQRLAMLRINPATLTPDRLTRTIVVPSPVTGYVTQVPVNNGRYLNPADVLADLINVDDLHVRLSIFEKDIHRIRVGERIRFRMGNDAGPQHGGTIFLLGKSITADRTIPVLAHPDHYTSDLIPGGYVSAQVTVSTEPLQTVPETAVVSFGGRFFIYVLEYQTAQPVTYQFRQVDVTPGIRQRGYMAIGLKPGVDLRRMPIVLRGAYSLLAKLNNSEEE